MLLAAVLRGGIKCERGFLCLCIYILWLFKGSSEQRRTPTLSSACVLRERKEDECVYVVTTRKDKGVARDRRFMLVNDA